ncbi:MAG: asparagine--tRNA ligase [Candidatus Aenigmarchaeota archaeon]|nr:asparagine--tRNA ligase [Candidatus Aenigmarchaeota archaeon]
MKIKDVFGKDGEVVELKGWVYRHRTSKEVVFVVLRDSSGIIQCTFKKGVVPDEIFERAEDLSVESSVIVKGRVKKDERAPGGYEIVGEGLEVVHKAERFPIVRDKSKEFLRDVRHLWLRSREMTSVLKIRSTVFGAIHEFFRSRGFYEVQAPIFTTAGSEGGSTLFEVDYFGKKVYLTQSWQLYAEAMIFSLEKIYTVAPSFRAEKSKTSRHLTEFWHAEMEAAWMDFDELAKTAEGLIKHICDRVLEENMDDLKVLNVDPERLKLELPFRRITYEEVLRILKENGMEVPRGKDLGAKEETNIAKILGGKPILITHYPKEIMAFYKKRDPNNPKYALNFNLIVPDVGEVLDASEREPDINEIIKSLKADGADPKDYDFYLDTRRYGSVPHSGFGMGIDRVVQWICGLDSIQEAIPFPRTIKRVEP